MKTILAILVVAALLRPGTASAQHLVMQFSRGAAQRTTVLGSSTNHIRLGWWHASMNLANETFTVRTGGETMRLQGHELGVDALAIHGGALEFGAYSRHLVGLRLQFAFGTFAAGTPTEDAQRIYGLSTRYAVQLTLAPSKWWRLGPVVVGVSMPIGLRSVAVAASHRVLPALGGCGLPPCMQRDIPRFTAETAVVQAMASVELPLSTGSYGTLALGASGVLDTLPSPTYQALVYLSLWCSGLP